MKKFLTLFLILYVGIGSVFAGVWGHKFFILRNRESGEYKKIFHDFFGSYKWMVWELAWKLEKISIPAKVLDNWDYVAKDQRLWDADDVFAGDITLYDSSDRYEKYANFSEKDFSPKERFDFYLIYYLGEIISFFLTFLFYILFVFGFINLVLYKLNFKKKILLSMVLLIFMSFENITYKHFVLELYTTILQNFYMLLFFVALSLFWLYSIIIFVTKKAKELWNLNYSLVDIITFYFMVPLILYQKYFLKYIINIINSILLIAILFFVNFQYFILKNIFIEILLLILFVLLISNFVVYYKKRDSLKCFYLLEFLIFLSIVILAY